MSNLYDWRKKMDLLQRRRSLLDRYIHLNGYFTGSRPEGIPEEHKPQLRSIRDKMREIRSTLLTDFYSDTEIFRIPNIKIAHLIERMELIQTQVEEEKNE